MPLKVFSLDEANSLLPQVRRGVNKLQESIGEIVRTQDALSVLEVLGGSDPAKPEHAEFLKKRAELESMAAAYNSRIDELQALGCVLKDLNHGVVDFYGLKDGRLIFLCWRMDEPSIGYWHEIDAGMAGRRPVGEL